MALAARIEKRDTRVIIVMGDGEINEGSVWEAALSAAKHRLSNLTVMGFEISTPVQGTSHDTSGSALGKYFAH